MQTDYKARYKRIAQTESFKKAYSNRSIGEVIEYSQVVKMTDEQKYAMYMKLTKSEIVRMMIELEKHTTPSIPYSTQNSTGTFHPNPFFTTTNDTGI